MTYAVPDYILDKSDALAREGRIIGGNWRRNGGDGGALEMVCALASWENGGKINAVSDCPNTYAPRWLLELIPTLDDGLPDDASRAQFVLGLNARARRWSALDEPAWERVRVSFLKRCITLALEKAEALQPSPRPDYWDKVQEACGLVLAALDGKGDLRAAEAAAEAAEAAWAAWAAEAVWAAREAVWAARAARAAVWAARAARAEAAAWAAAAYQDLIDHLFSTLDTEIGDLT